jgi:hypothetical protein
MSEIEVLQVEEEPNFEYSLNYLREFDLHFLMKEVKEKMEDLEF